MQELFSKPDAIENLQGTFCANTQGIFQGILLISDIWGVLEKETRFLPNELTGFLFRGLTVLITVEELKHTCCLDW